MTLERLISFSHVSVDENGVPGPFTDFWIKKLHSEKEPLSETITRNFEAAKRERMRDEGMMTLKLRKRRVNGIQFTGYASQVGSIYSEVWFFGVNGKLYQVESIIGSNDIFNVLSRLFAAGHEGKQKTPEK